MNRTSFVLNSAVCAVSAAMKPLSKAAEPKGPENSSSQKANLKLGTQHGDSNEILKVMAAFGVNHICALAPELEKGGDFSLEGLTRKREHIESHGIKADALRLIHPSYIAKSEIQHV